MFDNAKISARRSNGEAVLEALTAPRFRTASSLLTLEPRVVFDGAVAATADAVADQLTDEIVEADAHPEGDASSDLTGSDITIAGNISSPVHDRTEIAFVDASVSNLEAFLGGIDASVEIILLDPGQDGVEQIASTLAERNNIDALHILAHGDEGSLRVGNSVLDADSMQGGHLDELITIGNALSPDGDILIYGCDFTEGDAGLEAAMLLGSITGADIAASADATGHADFGGDWVLETEVGDVRTETLAVAAWRDTLSTSVINDRTSFEDLLNMNASSTVIDDDGAFAPDPTDANGIASTSRTGNIGTDGFSYTVYDVDFSNTPTGTITPGAVGGDIARLSSLDVEVPQVVQDGARGDGTWGVDSSTGSNLTRNALLFDFTQTAGDIGLGHFAAELHDVESSQLTGRQSAEYRIYRSGSLIDSGIIDWGTNDGNRQSNFFGYIAQNPSEFFDQIMIVVGDDDTNGDGTGNAERLAADRITFGQAFNNNPPVAVDDTYDVIPGVTQNIDPRNNGDTDPDGDTFNITGIIDPANPGTTLPIASGSTVTLASGTVIEMQSDGTLNITQPFGSDGTETFDYEITDTFGFSDVATVTLRTDSDGDGVANVDDIDDDNDGILDVNEGLIEPAAGYSFVTDFEFEDGTIHSVRGASFELSSTRNLVDEQGHPDAPNGKTFVNGFDVNGSTAAFGFDFTDQQHIEVNSELVIEGWYYDALGGGSNTASYITNLLTGELRTDQGTFSFGHTLSAAEIAELASNNWLLVEFRIPVTSTNLDINGFELQIESLSGGVTAGGFNPVSSEVFAFGINEIRSDIPEAGLSVDTDRDGIADHVDIDSDNDGITDNVEAQATARYIAPSGTGAAMQDSDDDGLDDRYDTTPLTGAAGSRGLDPVDTDSDGTDDFRDLNSDGDNIDDVAERGTGNQTTIPTGPFNDVDGDGLLDVFEGASSTDGFDVNDENLDPTNVNFLLADTDNDTPADGTGATPLTADLDFRDVNAVPVAINDTFTTFEDVSTQIFLLENDTDADGTALTLTHINGTAIDISSSPANVAIANGSVTVETDGSIRFNPNAGYSGPVSFTYTIADVQGETATATATGTVIPAEYTPGIVFDGATSQEQHLVQWGHQNSDASPDSINSTYIAAASNEVAHGGLTLNIYSTTLNISGVTADSLSQAIAQGDYLEYSVTVADPLPEGIQLLLTGADMYNPASGPAHDRTIVASTDPTFAEAVTLGAHSAATNDNTVTSVSEPTPLVVKPGDTVYFRTYFYNNANEPQAVNYDDFAPQWTFVLADDNSLYLEGNPPIEVAPAIGNNVSDWAENDIVELTITPSGILDAGDEQLTIAGTTFTFGTDQTVSGVMVNGTLLDIDYTGGIFTVTNAAGAGTPISEATLEILVNGITYVDTKVGVTTGERVLTFEVTDVNGNVSNEADARIRVAPVDDSLVPDNVVEESDLAIGTTPSDTDETATGTIVIDNSYGIQAVHINGTQVTAPPSPASPFVLPGTHGTLVLNGFNFATFEVSYEYTLDMVADHSAGAVNDVFVVAVTDGFGRQVEDPLVINIVDDEPEAADDTNSVSGNSSGVVTGNVVSSNDVIGADKTASPVVGVVAGNGPAEGTGQVGVPIAGLYGTLTLNADGSYRYDLNEAHPAVKTLRVGETLDDIFTYAIADGDFSFAEAALTITIDGAAVPVQERSVSFEFNLEGGVDPTPSTPPNGRLTGATVGLRAPGADGMVIDTVNDIDPLAKSETGLDVNGIVVDTVDEVASLGGLDYLSIFDPNLLASATEADVRTPENNGLDAFERLIAEWGPEGWHGYSLTTEVADMPQQGDSNHNGTIVIETLKRDRILYVEITNTLDPSVHGHVVRYNIVSVDGTPLPHWLDVIETGTIICDVPADIPVLKLQITAELEDGAKIPHAISVQTSTGEIEQLETVADAASVQVLFERQLIEASETQHGPKTDIVVPTPKTVQ